MGKTFVIVFASIEGAITWMRLFAAEESLDAISSDFKISYARTATGSMAIIVQFSATDSYLCDTSARFARLSSGVCYTGTAKTFVLYRERAAPFGYDVVEPFSPGKTTDFSVHDRHSRREYRIQKVLSTEEILRQLSLRKVPFDFRTVLGNDTGRTVYMAVSKGLAEGVMRYMWRYRIAARASLVYPENTSSFRPVLLPKEYFWLEVKGITPRALASLSNTPGITAFTCAADNVFVELGFSHPIRLSSCRQLLPQDTGYILWGGHDLADTISLPLQYVQIQDLVRVDMAELMTPVVAKSEPPAPGWKVEVGVYKLEDLSSVVSVPVKAVWLSSAELHKVRQLVYLLPQELIADYQIAMTDQGTMIRSSRPLEWMPIGIPLTEVARGFYVPFGQVIRPKVSPQVLDEVFSFSTPSVCLLREGTTPIVIAHDCFVALSRKVVVAPPWENSTQSAFENTIDPSGLTAADTRVDTTANTLAHADDSTGPRIGYRTNRFALWGYKQQDSAHKKLKQ